MNNQITIREAVSETDIAFFWDKLDSHFREDIFPDPNEEDREYFLGNEYRESVERLRTRLTDPAHFLFFSENGKDIGLALPVIYHTEDGKCFIMEFCVFPPFRGNGTGTYCAKILLDWSKQHEAKYAELNYGENEKRLRFWKRLGFRENGSDEWGDPLLLLPPEETVAITVEKCGVADWQLYKLMNGFLKEIGEDPLPEEGKEHLAEAIRQNIITFFVAKRGYRSVGMCSVTTCFSTFSCSPVAVFDDFYIEPVFRKHGIARLLVDEMRAYCQSQGIASITVTSAPCDENMYQSLGFDTGLGKTYACIP